MDGSGSPCCLSDHGAGIHPVLPAGTLACATHDA